MSAYVALKIEPSKNAIVRKALEQYLERFRKQELEIAMKEAAKDSMFMDDLNLSMRDFKSLDEEK